MRYGETHKQQTHEKLVGLAGRALRERGPDQLGVAELMRSAGLTHGGFYAHFGCPIVALNSDLPRQSRRFRSAFTAGVKSLLAVLAAWIEESALTATRGTGA
jgi:hypothetical protein